MKSNQIVVVIVYVLCIVIVIVNYDMHIIYIVMLNWIYYDFQQQPHTHTKCKRIRIVKGTNTLYHFFALFHFNQLTRIVLNKFVHKLQKSKDFVPFLLKYITKLANSFRKNNKLLTIQRSVYKSNLLNLSLVLMGSEKFDNSHSTNHSLNGDARVDFTVYFHRHKPIDGLLMFIHIMVLNVVNPYEFDHKKKKKPWNILTWLLNLFLFKKILFNIFILTWSENSINILCVFFSPPRVSILIWIDIIVVLGKIKFSS